MGKIDSWVATPGRKLRVVFEDDQFREYVDLPDGGGSQQQYERQLREVMGSKISLYKPGSAYRDEFTPPLDASNLRVVRDNEIAEGVKSKERNSPLPPSPAKTVKKFVAKSKIAGSSLTRTRRSCDYWWQALAAVPSSTEERDWWAKDDFRASKYDRLRRVWWDPTGMDWFYQPHQEDHLTVALWENLSIFPAAKVIAGICRAAGIHLAGDVTDCCWSYQFEAASRELCDVVVHFRDSQGDGLIVVESKKPRNIMKPLSKDVNPGYYLGVKEFAGFDRRYLIYLVDERDVDRQRNSLGMAPDTVGFMTWQQLARLQLELVGTIDLPRQAREFLEKGLAWQFCAHWREFGMSFSNDERAGFQSDETVLCRGSHFAIVTDVHPTILGAEVFLRLIKEAGSLLVQPHIRSFICGMIQHQAWWYDIGLGETIHPYLAKEPSRLEINVDGPQKQRKSERQVERWRIPVDGVDGRKV